MTTPSNAQPLPPTATNTGEGSRDYLIAAMLSIFVGTFGVDRFYLGYIGSGIAKLFTFGGFGIWALIDVIRVITNDIKDADGASMRGFTQNKKTVWLIAGLLYLFNLLGFFGGLGLQLLIGSLEASIK